MRRILCLVGVLALAACAGAGTAGSVPSTSDSADMPQSVAMSSTGTSTTWTVQSGASTVDYAVQDLDFYANRITIDAGDNVRWRTASAEPHTVTFLAPGQSPPPPNSPQAQSPSGSTYYDGKTFTNSGLMFGGHMYTLKFLKPGTYVYYCLLHQPEMTGTVVVQKAGTPYPHTQGYYLHVGAEDEWLDLGAGQRSIALFPYPVHGTTLAAGIAPGLTSGPPADSTVMRFLDVKDHNDLRHSGDVTIHVGTTLTWVNLANNSPHTVTLPPAGQPLPPMNPFSPPSGGSTYDGSHLVNSGPFFPSQRFSLTFTKAGVYRYYCIFHAGEGMVSTVTVVR